MTIEMSNKEFDPQVGILGLYHHEIIFAHKISVTDGLPYGDAITGIKDHTDYWEELRLQGELDQFPFELRFEYFFHSAWSCRLLFRH